MKSVGYLPIYTIANVLKESVDTLTRDLSLRGLDVRLYQEDETCIKSGALFAFDTNMVRDLIELHKGVLSEKHWALDPEQAITKIAEEWYDESDAIIPFIRDLFGERK